MVTEELQQTTWTQFPAIPLTDSACILQSCVIAYTVCKEVNDLIVALATLEAMESVFEMAFKHIEQGGINSSYFRDAHVELSYTD